MNRYFFMEVDNTLPDSIGLRDFDIHGARQIFTFDDRKDINEVTALYLDATKGECAPDFMKSPVYMVSDMAKKVIELYEDEAAFKKVIFIHKEEERQLVYYYLLLKEIEALHETTVYYPNGMEKHMVLSQEKIGNHKAFLLADSLRKNPVISQEVVESLLRRQVMGIQFKEVEVS
ncbi:MAG: imm11 family protein [Lachnospiraceae bacterium]